MSFLERVKIVAKEMEEEEFNILELLKRETRFQQTATTLVQTVRYYDGKYPNIGAAEILAAILNDVMVELFPNIKLDD